MKKNLLVGLLIPFLLAACQPSAASPTAVQVAAPLPTFANQSNTPQPIPQSISTANPENLQPFYLRILWPEDGSLVSMPEVELLGEATPGAVISIGDEILLVPPEGVFRQTIHLEEGPNAIEIVASDISGEQQSFILTLVYEP